MPFYPIVGNPRQDHLTGTGSFSRVLIQAVKALLPHRVVALLGDDNMIQQTNPQKFSGLAQSFGHAVVFRAGLGLPRRVVVNHHQSHRTNDNGPLENLARMDCRTVGVADGDRGVGRHLMRAVQIERHDMFAAVVAHRTARKTRDGAGVAHFERRLARGLVVDADFPDHAVFYRYRAVCSLVFRCFRFLLAHRLFPKIGLIPLTS